MVLRSTLAGLAGAVFLFSAGAAPVAAQCGPGCDGPTDWTGFWVGAGIGGNFNMIEQDTKDYSLSIDDPATVLNWSEKFSERGASGFVGNIGLGYDWLIRDRFVLGAFTDFDFGSTEHSYKGRGSSSNVSFTFDQKNTWNIGGRFGLATSNTAMVYGLIGYSRTSMDIELTDVHGAYTFNHKKSVDYNGLLVGGGLEQQLGNGFSLKAEYRYTNYGNETFLDGTVENSRDQANPNDSVYEVDKFDLNTHAVRLTLAYKFGRRGDDVIEEVSYKDVPPAPSFQAPYK